MATIQGHQIPSEALPQDGELEADNDSTYGSGSGASETTSLSSSVVRGYVENGRRYQTVREGPGQYYVPADDKQFESIGAGHMTFLIMESQQKNPLFRSPIDESKVQNILDLGTGDGAWAIDVADRLPHAIVHGVDLYPPPQTFVPPNCILEVDDITQPFTFKQKFDLIHIRLLLGAFSFAEWDKLYKRAFDALAPGGWIEQVEFNIDYHSDDGSLPKDAKIATLKEFISQIAEESGNPINVFDEMRERIEKAGFLNLQEKVVKVPLGSWAKHQVYKDAGACNKIHFCLGIDGWATWLLTKFGKPKPWTLEEVKVWADSAKAEAEDPKHHAYQYAKRVWAQKPYDAKPKEEEQPVLENVAAA